MYGANWCVKNTLITGIYFVPQE